jgi:voltage-gated potassium channel
MMADMADTPTARQLRWRRATAIPLMVASVVFLVCYSWRVIADISGPSAVLLNSLLVITRLMFVVDYVVRLSIAPQKWVWFRTHLADLAITLVPVLRMVRLLRVFTELPGIRHSRSGLRRNRLAVYGVGSVAILVYLGALVALDVERPAPGATIVNFGDAIWWACTTATTTGYGDYTPITGLGRLVGVGLMFGGLVLIGILTATLSSWVADRAHTRADTPDAPPPPSEDDENGAS